MIEQYRRDNKILLDNLKQQKEEITELKNENTEILLELGKKSNKINLRENEYYMSYIN